MLVGIVAEFTRRGVVPVVEVAQAEEIVPLVDALLRGGLDVVEITLRTEAGLKALELARTHFPEVLVGAGTVRTGVTAHSVADAGAAFVVSPGLDQEVVAVCAERGIGVLPGICTPTELGAAVRAGVDVVKFFPAEAMGGVPFLKALLGPFRDVTFVPTGGIDPNNLGEYLKVPQVAACGGSWMVKPSLIAEGRFDDVERLTRSALEIVQTVRAEAGAPRV